VGKITDVPDKLQAGLTPQQYDILIEILSCLNAGKKPNIKAISEKLGCNKFSYYRYLQDQPFRVALRNVLESAIDIDTLILLKLRIQTDDINTNSLVKLYSETSKRGSGPQSFENMLDKEHGEKEDKDANSNTKSVSNVVSRINVPSTLQ